MDAKHAKHLHTTEAVEALWSKQGSQDATYWIALVSIQGSRDEVCQIANTLPHMEWSEFRQTRVAAERLDQQWTCSTPVTEKPLWVVTALAVE